MLGLSLLLLSSLIAVAHSQSCDNFGYRNSSGCFCPPGFGGPNCTDPACGGTIFQGSQRPITPASANDNLTAGDCTCQSGWTGTGCNVCQSSTACQTGVTLSINASIIPGTTQPDQYVCNTAPRVYAAGQMSCAVIVRYYSPPFLLFLPLIN
jgi:hypothetical protein